MENEIKFTPELKKNWIEALESGKYIQGQHRLYDREENKHCCLGVLCEVLQIPLESKEIGSDATEDESYNIIYNFIGVVNTRKAYEFNDTTPMGDGHYQNVLPFIKSLKTLE